MAKKDNRIRIKIVQLPHAQDLPVPAYQTAGSAGLDLMAAIPADEPLILKPGKRDLIPTGLILELPTGFEAQVRPRSGLAWKNGVTVLNSPGTIDSDYRGEVKVMLVNLGETPFKIERGQRIAQMIIAKVARAKIKSNEATAALARPASPQRFRSRRKVRRKKRRC
jgi:dUTP pyrophosphatase